MYICCSDTYESLGEVYLPRDTFQSCKIKGYYKYDTETGLLSDLTYSDLEMYFNNKAIVYPKFFFTNSYAKLLQLSLSGINEVPNQFSIMNMFEDMFQIRLIHKGCFLSAYPTHFLDEFCVVDILLLNIDKYDFNNHILDYADVSVFADDEEFLTRDFTWGTSFLIDKNNKVWVAFFKYGIFYKDDTPITYLIPFIKEYNLECEVRNEHFLSSLIPLGNNKRKGLSIKY